MRTPDRIVARAKRRHTGRRCISISWRNDMVNTAATVFVNKPGRANERVYLQSLKARGDYEKRFKKEIERERKSGAWNEPPIGADHPEYRQLDVAGGYLHQKNPVAGRRVPGSSDLSVPQVAPGVSAYAYGPDMESLQTRLVRQRGEEPQAAGPVTPQLPRAEPRALQAMSETARGILPEGATVRAPNPLPPLPTHVSRRTSTDTRMASTNRETQTDGSIANNPLHGTTTTAQEWLYPGLHKGTSIQTGSGVNPSDGHG